MDQAIATGQELRDIYYSPQTGYFNQGSLYQKANPYRYRAFVKICFCCADLPGKHKGNDKKGGLRRTYLCYQEQK